MRSVSQLRSRIRSWRAFGETVALVPLSGALHEGHSAPLRVARAEADRVLAALFVDPLDRQDDGEFLATENEDAEFLDREQADAMYAPSIKTLYPADFGTEISVGPMAHVMCGADNPGRFRGFIRSQVKIMNQSQADIVVFGERDWQRLAILRRLARDLDLPPKMLVAATERDEDGIAISSGSISLGDEDRKIAARLWRTLTAAANAIAAGEPADPTLDAAADKLADAGAEVEFLEMRDPDSLAEIEEWTPGRQARIFAAIVLDGVRLTDNVAVGA